MSEDEQVETPADEDTKEVSKKKRKSMAPGQGPLTKKPKLVNEIQAAVKRLKKEYQVSRHVVYHALIIHSGDLELAEEYIASGGISFVKPWTPEEDQLLMGSVHDCAAVFETRGREPSRARIAWLES